MMIYVLTCLECVSGEEEHPLGPTGEIEFSEQINILRHCRLNGKNKKPKRDGHRHLRIGSLQIPGRR